MIEKCLACFKGDAIMEEGILTVKGDMLYFDIPGITSIQLQQEAKLEIYLGGVLDRRDIPLLQKRGCIPS